ncbi:hypothetical protein PAPHI01_1191 [Pancytospora philotis]|nr:hypothetical protein PAPHI01_1191 [Pancytospora philotis]
MSLNEQRNRLYYEIIDEVCNRLTEEGPLYDIDQSTVYMLQTEWIKTIEKMLSEESVGDDESLNIDLSKGYISEEELEQIEKGINSYMMCLFVKVAKSKNKWKCNFKQGFINVDNNDIPFSVATGELEW